MNDRCTCGSGLEYKQCHGLAGRPDRSRILPDPELGRCAISPMAGGGLGGWACPPRHRRWPGSMKSDLRALLLA
ncbi:MAG TPA: hypothetical protein DCY40_06610 [Actinobacteria bacterium]|nr:hypothetical protein [Actinomycetota bacterium]